jgi:hypothetical protein
MQSVSDVSTADSFTLYHAVGQRLKHSRLIDFVSLYSNFKIGHKKETHNFKMCKTPRKVDQSGEKSSVNHLFEIRKLNTACSTHKSTYTKITIWKQVTLEPPGNWFDALVIESLIISCARTLE